jgi:hypothetical protein
MFKTIKIKIKHFFLTKRLERAILKGKRTGENTIINLYYGDIKKELKHRAIGKTFCLIKMANKYDMPIIVRDYGSVGHIKNLVTTYNLNMPKVIVASLFQKNYGYFPYYKGYLFDEGIDEQLIPSIIASARFVVGFVAKYIQKNKSMKG